MFLYCTETMNRKKSHITVVPVENTLVCLLAAFRFLWEAASGLHRRYVAASHRVRLSSTCVLLLSLSPSCYPQAGLDINSRKAPAFEGQCELVLYTSRSVYVPPMCQHATSLARIKLHVACTCEVFTPRAQYDVGSNK